MYCYFEINENEYNIRCKIYYQKIENIQRIILFGHGFGGHKDNGAAEKFAQQLIEKHKDCAMITFNWPGHGDDLKESLYLSECSDYLKVVLAYIQQKFQTDEIYSYATSFGGYLVLKYIHEHGNPFRKIALRCPAVNMYDVLTNVIMTSDELNRLKNGEEIPVGFDRKIMVGQALLEELRTNDIQQWNYLDYAENILILHGTDDEIVPFEAAYNFAKRNHIKCVPVDNADHRFLDEEKMNFAIKCIMESFDL